MADRPTSRFRLRYGERVHVLTPGTCTVGRDASCDIVLDDRMASRQHARFVVGERVVVEDAGSVNGITVNGVTVRGSVPLSIGDRVGVAATVFVLTEIGHAAPPTRPKPTLVPPEPLTEMELAALEGAVEIGDLGGAEAAATAVMARATRSPPGPEVLARLEVAFLRLAGEAETFWLERILELRAVDGSVPSADVVARLHALSRAGTPPRDSVVRAYLASMEKRTASLVTGDRFVYRRLEALLRARSDG